MTVALRLLVALGTAALFVPLAPVAPAQAAACNPASTSRGDLDGDGRADLVIGVPEAAGTSGVIDVRYTGRASEILRQKDFGRPDGAGSRFGSAVEIGDLDGDGCADVVASAPGAVPADPGAASVGAVHILFGSPTGLLRDSAVTVTQLSSQWETGFGTAIAVGPDQGDGSHELYVGAPDREVNTRDGAGAVHRFLIRPGGPSRVTLDTLGLWTQDTPDVPGTAEAGDHFGQVLAPAHCAAVSCDVIDGVIAAAPDEDLGAARDAGAVWYLDVWPSGRFVARSWSQNSPGITGAAETGDHFGASLSRHGTRLAVGVPDEDLGSARNAGMVHILDGTNAAVGYRQTAVWSQAGSTPGTAETGDRFGATVLYGYGALCPQRSEITVGAPGEDVGRLRDAGSVTLVPDRKPFTGCVATQVRQGRGLTGAPEAGDRVGAALGQSLSRTDDDFGYSKVIVGAPGESIAAVTGAGMVQTQSGIEVDGDVRQWVTYSAGNVRDWHYGSVISTTFD